MQVRSWWENGGPFRREWALLYGIVLTAVLFRFWQLGNWPPGLYRDEAFNGLDALGVLNGNHAIFFTANNGREPGYIYLTAVSLTLFGRSPFAMRLAAAVVGSLTTLFLFLLGKQWFNHRLGLLVALLWGITLWPVHLSRIGLRTILLPLMLTLTAYLFTRAWQKSTRWRWLLAGAVYGGAFYTYLAVRLTPLLLGLIILFLLWQFPEKRRPFLTGLLWFGAGTAVVLLPFLGYLWQNPDSLLGRSGQVSIFNPAISGGDPVGTFFRQLGQTLGLFFWRGDDILRHNPAQRPLFDPLMAGPFLLGVGLSLKRWRQPVYTVLLLWTAVMLLPTLFAEDAPHFLRSVGILPAVLFFPAVGLAWLWQWTRFPRWLTQTAVYLLLLGSAAWTIVDYTTYARDPAVALLFEAAALDLGQQIAAEPPETAVYLDRWFWDDATQRGWPTVPFIAPLDDVQLYRPELGVTPPATDQPVSLYAWQFGSLAFVPQLFPPPVWVTVRTGPPARGDLEPAAYSLYVNYRSQPMPSSWPMTATFGETFWLRDSTAVLTAPDQLSVQLTWAAQTTVLPPLTAFVQVIGPDGVIGQLDLPPGGPLWVPTWWQPGVAVQETRVIPLSQPFDPTQHRVLVGLYDPATLERLMIEEIGSDAWAIEVQQ